MNSDFILHKAIAEFIRNSSETTINSFMTILDLSMDWFPYDRDLCHES